MKIYRAAAFAAKIGVHKNTVKAWSLKGKLPDRRTPAGHRYYTEADVDRYFGVERAPEPDTPWSTAACPAGRKGTTCGRNSRRWRRSVWERAWRWTSG